MSIALLLGLFPMVARALILLGPDENPVPPQVPGAEALSGFVGELITTNAPAFLGTPISPRHFLTAAHVPFGTGNSFFYRQHEYRILARTNLPLSDLAVGTVDSDFPAFSELYERDDEERRRVVVLGKGRWKGEPVLLDGELRGWRQQNSGTPGIRWGTNIIARTVIVSNPEPDEVAGSFLVADFDRNGGDDEVFLTEGDSGGPMFMADCGTWKLAAVATAVDGPYSVLGRTNDIPFLAALFDAGGLYLHDHGTPQLIPDLVEDVPASWYAARVSARITELRQIAGLPSSPPPPRPADQFVWHEGQPIVIPLAVTNQSGAADTTVACVDNSSLENIAVAWYGAAAEYTATLPVADVDSFRYIVRNVSGSTWGSVFVLSPPMTSNAPLVRLASDGTVVVLWPAPGQPVVAVESAHDSEGPWEQLEQPPAVLDGFVVFADARNRGAPRQFYRFILAAPSSPSI